jgi:hypothetical protein
MSWIEAILGIGNKVLDHFTPGERKRKRRNKIEKLEKRQAALAKMEWSEDRARKFERNRIALNKLYKEAKSE